MLKVQDQIYKNWLGQKVLIRGEYKIILGRFLSHLFQPSMKGYKLINGKWKYITTYALEVVDNVPDLIRQIEYHIKLNHYNKTPF